MRRHIRGIAIVLLLLGTLGAFGQQSAQSTQSAQSWQGNAAVARSGEFTAPGLFAASNAFAENTTILVENNQTGQSVQVTVVQRIQSTGNIFLLLSEEAGKQIGLTGSEVIRVRASVVSPQGTELSDSLRDEAYSKDPDINPAVSVTEEQLGPEAEPPVQEAQPEESTEIAQAPAPLPAPAPSPASEPVGAEVPEEAGEQEAPEKIAAAEPPTEEVAEIPEEQPEELVEEAPAAPSQTPEEKRLQEVTDRVPQKQLYMPPRQQEVYALAPEPAPVEEVEEEIAAAEPPTEEVAEIPEEQPEELVEEAAEEAEEQPLPEEQPPQVSMPGPEAEEEPLEIALPGPEATEPEKPSPEGTRLPVPEEESPLTMAPEEPPTTEIGEVAAAEQEIEAEPEEQPAAEVAMAETAAAETTPAQQAVLSDTLPASTYFLQLGAYSTRRLAEKLAGDLTQTYSVTILPASSGGRRLYRVLVGPLNVDESGTLLYQFRSRGFKDAFIQYVE